MNRYLLDTSSLLALRDDEAGADQVADLLYRAQRGEVVCLACFMTLTELFYRIWRDEGEASGRLAYEQSCALPIQWVHEDQPLLEKAAELKATHAISLTDAWIAAAAIQQDAQLVHKDPELIGVPCRQLPLPHKN
ncbi:MAG: PIN domain-containing protein [Anaerolineales bacterium]|nr:PIN domain-containing protein [Anaerolineales bacterium]